MSSRIPKNVKNPKLYKKIKSKIRKDVDKNNRQWGAYDSGRLVKEYKKAGGTYTGKKSKKSLYFIIFLRKFSICIILYIIIFITKI